PSAGSNTSSPSPLSPVLVTVYATFAPACPDVHNGATSSRRQITSPRSPWSRTATSLAPGPPPDTNSPPGATEGGVCGVNPSGTAHFGLPSAAFSAHNVP